nr:RNA-directed DNA polymerase, eukaryota, reverse transcriptase zinc-binding domain protein [Tanacetum cinerariifolium]
MEKVKDSVDENSLADLNDLNDFRGMKKWRKRVWLKDLCFKNNIHFLGIQGSKITRLETFRLKSIWDNYNFDSACSMARGRSGGHWRNTVGDCYMINIYGIQDSLAKAILWNRIGDFMHQYAGKYIIFGDMIVVRNENERSGSIFSRQDADNFNSFIDNSGLIDLPLGGRLFTCINKSGTKLSKLDRFLISKEVAEALVDVRVATIDRLWSDHNPILLRVSKSDFSHTPLKLFHSWLLCGLFDEVNKMELPKLKEYNFGMKLLSHEKFRLLKARIQQWHSETKTSNRVIKHDNLRAQMINGIMKEGVWIHNPPQITKEFLNCFKEKFKDHDSNVDFLMFGNSSGLCALDRDNLETPVSFDEIKNAVDFEKAFDSVSWEYLDYALLTLGFGSKWRSWIRACLPSSRALVLVNGSPISEFSIKHGLRQGDHFSSFLFILVMEGLHNALSIAVSSGLIRGVKFSYPEIPTNVFLGGSHEARKLAWIKWKNVLYSYNNGGLNIGSLKAFNLTLLQKWRWRLLSHKNALWVKVIKALHGQEGGFDNNGCIYNEINEVEDTCVWSLGTNESFSVKDARCIIDSNILPSLAPSLAWDKTFLERGVSALIRYFLFFFLVALETLVSFDEVKNAVWDGGSYKALGPDGFSFAFAKIYWDCIKVNILEYVNIFLDTGSLPHGSTFFFSTLIPKVSNLIFIKDFGPISLTGVHYKIIAKIQAKLIDKIVSHEQSAFIVGRQILDGPLILNYVLLTLGFGSKWRFWIRACLSSSRASVLVNGSPTSEYSIKRGLRQGDPLSSFLFILGMEGLHNALSIAVRSGLIRGVKFGSPEVLLDRFQSKLSSWKTNLPSIGGRHTLIKAVLGSLGIYYFSIFKVPESVLNSLKRSRAMFFFGRLKAFNLALLQKWGWRLLSHKNALWVKVIKALHGQEGGFDNNGCIYNGTWARILGSYNFLHSNNIIPNSSFRFQAGYGTRIRF